MGRALSRAAESSQGQRLGLAVSLGVDTHGGKGFSFAVARKFGFDSHSALSIALSNCGTSDMFVTVTQRQSQSSELGQGEDL